MTREPAISPGAASPDSKPEHFAKPCQFATSEHQLESLNLRYTAEVGEIEIQLPATEEDSIGRVSYSCYRQKGRNRPVLFCFNGGPGSSSMWLHTGCFGPMRVSNLGLQNQHLTSHLVENKESLLDWADLVFVDPIGTGFSNLGKQSKIDGFCTDNQDADYLVTVVEKILNRQGWWGQPIFLLGESYGGYRVCLMAEKMLSRGLKLDGIAMIAPFISGVSLVAHSENLIGRIHNLISWSLAAYFHQKSSLCEKYSSEEQAYKASCDFFTKQLLPEWYGQNWQSLPDQIITETAQHLGVSEAFLLKHGDSFDVPEFSKELFPGQRNYPGRLDCRFTLPIATDFFPVAKDPSYSLLLGNMTGPTQAWLRQHLGFETDSSYVVFSEDVIKTWKYEEPFFSKASQALGEVINANPSLKVYVASGYYDLAVSVASVDFDLRHLKIGAEARKRICHQKFAAGHMMYIEDPIRAELKKGLTGFLAHER